MIHGTIQVLPQVFRGVVIVLPSCSRCCPTLGLAVVFYFGLVGYCSWCLCFVIGLLVGGVIKLYAVCIQSCWFSLLYGFFPTKGVAWWLMETRCSSGVFISFKGERCYLTHNGQRASYTLSPHLVGRPFRPKGFLPGEGCQQGGTVTRGGVAVRLAL